MKTFGRLHESNPGHFSHEQALWTTRPPSRTYFSRKIRAASQLRCFGFFYMNIMEVILMAVVWFSHTRNQNQKAICYCGANEVKEIKEQKRRESPSPGGLWTNDLWFIRHVLYRCSTTPVFNYLISLLKLTDWLDSFLWHLLATSRY